MRTQRRGRWEWRERKKGRRWRKGAAGVSRLPRVRLPGPVGVANILVELVVFAVSAHVSSLHSSVSVLLSLSVSHSSFLFSPPVFFLAHARERHGSHCPALGRAARATAKLRRLAGAREACRREASFVTGNRGPGGSLTANRLDSQLQSIIALRCCSLFSTSQLASATGSALLMWGDAEQYSY